MADLPRWVDRWDVDSQAMLSAFISYHTELSARLEEAHGLSFQPVWEGHLFCVIHAPHPSLAGSQSLTLPLRIPQAPCQQRACGRCGVRGGYVFRWYSPYWAVMYNKMRRPGSWRAMEPLYLNDEADEEYMRLHERFWRPTEWVDPVAWMLNRGRRDPESM